MSKMPMRPGLEPLLITKQILLNNRRDLVYDDQDYIIWLIWVVDS